VLGGLGEDAYVDRLERMNDGVRAPYRSVDARGRVWGAPNAGGSRQCEDCPNKARGNSLRCVECEKKLASRKYTAMDPADLELLKSALSTLVAREQWAPGKARDIAMRIDILYASSLTAGSSPACKASSCTSPRRFSPRSTLQVNTYQCWQRRTGSSTKTGSKASLCW